MSSELQYHVAILAGGRSTRMGRDKALLVHEGSTLLERQIRLAWSIGPAAVHIVGRDPARYVGFGADVIADTCPGMGPLGGLATVLQAVSGKADHVLVIAVDMPALTAVFLNRLLAMRSAGVGVAPRSVKGWEPLVALYPTCLAEQAGVAVAGSELGMGRFLERVHREGFIRCMEVTPAEADVFENWNTPDDLPHPIS
jgi:molybdopterin-guanine dinucleotide biosynthesis protein A